MYLMAFLVLALTLAILYMVKRPTNLLTPPAPPCGHGYYTLTPGWEGILGEPLTKPVKMILRLCYEKHRLILMTVEFDPMTGASVGNITPEAEVSLTKEALGDLALFGKTIVISMTVNGPRLNKPRLEAWLEALNTLSPYYRIEVL